MQYAEFIAQKTRQTELIGIEPTKPIGPLFDWQIPMTEWALRLGRACIFADCGMGKTIMQIEWARQVEAETGLQSLILAPLAVAAQSIREGERFGYKIGHVGSSAPIVVTNYQQLHNVDLEEYGALVLDESSILKSHTGKYRTALIDAAQSIPFRLACSATPAPNDFMELGNHAQFVGAMTRAEMLAMYFNHDGGSTQNWKIKGHAKSAFWSWVRSWAIVARRPSDVGGSDEGFILPPIAYYEHTISSAAPEGELFAEISSPDLQARRAARKSTIEDRCKKAASLVAAENEDQWVVWCDLNAESDMLARMIPDSVEIRGSDTDEHKSTSMMDFAEGKIRVLVTKPSIAGWGMNWQNCARMAFVGLSDSYEMLYQATRRCWRFGQLRDVAIHIIIGSGEGAVLANVMRKERDHKHMQDQIAEAIASAEEIEEMENQESTGSRWRMVHGDCVDAVREIADDSIDYTVFSPPFASLYTYSNSPNDMGNCSDGEEFAEHFAYLIPQLYRVTAPGRLVSFHCMNLPTSKVRDGVIGLRDFRGELIRMFSECGWIYHSEVCIWKDPVTAMQRTKALGLLHKTIRKDSAMSRQGIPDYVVTMRKPGENQKPISHQPEQFPVSLWQQWASPIWTDINPNDTLTFRTAREDDDERHICPLQLEVIKRCLALWSNPGDLVLSPFAGIGSEGYEALRWDRRFVGIELKRSYYELAVKNLRDSVEESSQHEMFS